MAFNNHYLCELKDANHPSIKSILNAQGAEAYFGMN